METNDIYLDKIIASVLLLKILSMLFIAIAIYLHYNNHRYKDLFNSLEHYTQILLLINLGLLMVYLFHHLTPAKVCVQGHVKMYLYLFGILSIFSGLKKIMYNILDNYNIHNKTLREYIDLFLQ